MMTFRVFIFYRLEIELRASGTLGKIICADPMAEIKNKAGGYQGLW
jgi:hypothetical protein